MAGENNSNSKLKEDEVWEILELYYEDEWTVKELLEEFKVGRGTITDIVYGRTWKPLYEEYMGRLNDKDLFKKPEEDKKPTGNNGLMGRPVQWGDDH